ncbi:MAG: multiprotein bridging factor aMBF1 [Candidatus Hecatellaceae archaeon]
MRCEICGSQIWGKPRKALIEGATLIVCEECAKHSSQTMPLTGARRGGRPPVGLPLPKERKPQPKSVKPSRNVRGEDYMIVEGFGGLIKKFREQKGWTQEELAFKIGEKASFVGKLETEKVYPSFDVARKLEHVLGVKLISRVVESPIGESYLKPQPSKGR